jgi:hypothetical protein
MSADTLTLDGSAGVLAAPDSATFGQPGYTYAAVGYAAVPGMDEVAVIYQGVNAASHYSDLAVAGYGLDGGMIFKDAFAASSFGVQSLVIGAERGGPIAIGYEQVSPGAHFGQAYVDSATIAPSGSVIEQSFYYPQRMSPGPLSIQPAGPGSLKLVWDAHASSSAGSSDWARETQYFGADGQPVNGLQTESDLSIPLVAQAVDTARGAYVLITDNNLEFHGPGGVQATGIPNEPAHAITSLAAAALTDGRFAVAWADSGTDYVSVYDSTANTFGPVAGLDWGGADHVHAVALADGGFAVSWMKGGAYQGEVFDSAGNGGGIISLAGDLAGIDSRGGLYTVGLDSNGAYSVQTYAVNGGGGSGSTGGGSTYTSDNAGDHWTGTTADETFNLGRGGDMVTGGGGNDTFKFAETPWAGGHITDFSLGDSIDLTGLLAASGYTGSDPVADGYLKLTTDSNGNGQVWSDINQAGNSGWWLVTTVDGVGAYDMQLQNGVITHTPGPGSDGTVSTADPNYKAPDGVTKIILTGSQQTVTGNNGGDTFVSNDTGNHLVGGTGSDTFDLGRGGDIVTGGASADTYVYQETPWSGGRITDFSVSQGDRIDLNALLAHAGYTSGDPVAEGYIKILDTTNGAQIWSDPDGPGSASGWWLVDTLNGVSAGSIKLSDGLVTGGGDGSVIVEDARYVPSRTAVTSITVAGASAQQIFGNDLGITYHDNNNANLLVGGGGNDTFIPGLGGSLVSTGSGADTVVINAVPNSNILIAGYTAGTDRIDLHGLLSSIGSTGSDPFHDGHLEFVATSDSSGQYTEMLAYNPDRGQWIDVAAIYNVTPSQLHYSDGWLT